MKSYVIQLAGIKESETLANDCVNSGQRFGLQIEKFNGVYGESQILETMKCLDIKPYSDKMKKHRLGVKGCFLSHYLLWLECAENNSELLIFEHDAILLRPLPSSVRDSNDEFLILDPFNKFTRDYSKKHSASSNNEQKIVEYYNPSSKEKYGVTSEYAMGLQAYIIRPTAANKLISAVRNNGFLPADMQCNKDVITLRTVSQSIASVNKLFYGNKDLMNQYSTTKRNW